jgi:hypothetical protein
MMIVNVDSRVANKLEASLTDDARVVINYCHMFIVQATGDYPRVEYKKELHSVWFQPCQQTLDLMGKVFSGKTL